MTVAAAASRPSPRYLDALRHFVYTDLESRLSPASYDQAVQVAINLGYAAGDAERVPLKKASEAARRSWLMMAVSPDIATVRRQTPSVAEIERFLNERYGDDLEYVAGFYRLDGESGPFRLSLPKCCVFYFYRGPVGTIAGVLCQPLELGREAFLLSSRRFGGQKAAGLMPADRILLKRA